jgi:aryl carrier-like protein
MSDFSKRLEMLSPAKRELMKLFLQEQRLQAPRQDHVAPRTPVEMTLVAIWSQVLGVEGIGVHNNFFALGGDSIHSIQVVARAKRAGLDLTSAQLFRYPTIAELTAFLPASAEVPLREKATELAVREDTSDRTSPNTADFPDAELTPDDLQRIMKKIG